MRSANNRRLGEVPPKMNAWLIRENRFGEPTSSFQKEVVDVPSIKDDEVLVYVMAAGINYNNVWAALGIPVDVIKARQKAGEKEDFHIGGSRRVGHRLQGRQGRQEREGRRRGRRPLRHVGPRRSVGRRPATIRCSRRPSADLGLRDQLGQLRAVHQGAGAPVPAEAEAPDLGGGRGLHAGRRHRLPHAARLAAEHDVQPGDPVLIWGGAGGLGSMAIQIAKAAGAIPVAVVSGDDKIEYCKKLGAKGCIDRRKFDHWGMLPHWKDDRRLQQVAEGRARLRRGDLGGARREAEPDDRLRAPRRERPCRPRCFVCDTGGMVVICAGTTGYNATVDLRYLWMRQKRFQGSHFANDEQCYAMNELVLAGKVDPCMSRAFTYEELPLSHQLMHDNKHPHGNMAVLIGAPGFGLGKSAEAPVAVPRLTLAEGRSARSQGSAPVPGVGAAAGCRGRPRGHPRSMTTAARSANACMPGIISCSREDTLGQAGKTMIDNDIHALVVIDGDRAVGVLSQTDIVLARQGRTIEEARALTVGEVMTEGCATIEADEKLSVAITEMMKRRIHRLVVCEQGQAGRRAVDDRHRPQSDRLSTP